MLKHKSAFCLITFLVYSLCTFLIFSITIPWFVSLYKNITNQLAYTRNMLDIHVVHDLFLRDIKSAIQEESAWYEKNPQSCVFTVMNSKNCIGWYLKNNALVRYEGIYDSDKAQWKEYTHAKILSHVSHFKCIYKQKDKNIVQVQFTIATKDDLLIDGVSNTQQGVYTCLE